MEKYRVTLTTEERVGLERLPDRVSLHAQAGQLSEQGRDGDRPHESAGPQSASGQPGEDRDRGHRLGKPAKRSGGTYLLDLHLGGRTTETAETLPVHH
jgi:hypothetical protein